MAEGERDDLAELLARRALTEDAARSDAVEKRRAAGGRTARENLADLVDPGSFVEYGRFAIAAQRGRRELEDLIARTPADGLIGGTARVNGELFDPERAACAVLSYDYTVLAGTQGALGHRKKDRLFELIERMRLPVVFYAEGGGGRPGDTDYPAVSALDTRAFALWAKLSGLVPRIAIVHGRCFAGNAVLAGCADLIVATEGSSLGMGGPAMIAGGGLGDVDPDEVGPLETQAANGVVDVAVADEAEATAATKKLLAYFQGATEPGPAPDQARLRDLVPERKRRAYDPRPIVETLCDEGSVIFLRQRFAPEMVTALARIEGRPLGIICNDTRHMAGAVTSEASDKAARLLQLCDAFGLPVLSLVDTPGYMVGPEAEAAGLVRHASRLLVAGAALRVPLVAVVLRRGYGLGAQAMVGGSLHEPLLTVAWPSAHLGPMGLEGAVRLALRKELEAIPDEAEREQRVRDLTAQAEENARALNAAALFELDDVIDPAETRGLIAATLVAAEETRRHRARTASSTPGDPQPATSPRRDVTDYSDLKALFVNCTLKRSPETSNTQGLMDLSMAVMRKQGVAVESIRAIDHEIAIGVWPDMTEHGWERDEWPQIYEKVMAADILVLGMPIWLGEKSSVATHVIERLYGNSHLLNDEGQWAYYGRVGGCIVTGNEDGIKHCAMNVLYSLQHLGYTIPPQADSGWIGEAGPGPSYLDDGSGGPQNDFTNRNTAFAAWNLMHMARILKDAGGIPAHGNQPKEWEAGCHFDLPNPEHRV